MNIHLNNKLNDSVLKLLENLGPNDNILSS
jgi:hypothetical protein